MNQILCYIPATTAALLIFIASSHGQSDFSGTEHAPSADPISANRQLSEFEQSFQSALTFPGQVRVSAVPGAGGFALFSGIEFSLLQGQAPWIRSQIKSVDLIGRPQLRTFTSNNGREVAQAIETERPPSRIGFRETAEPDGSVPPPQTHNAAGSSVRPEDIQEKSLADKQNSDKVRSRVVLALGLQVSGWKQRSHGHPDVGAQTKATDPSTVLPPPAPASDLP